jgi:hypothetical protein|tara:strand:+ start:122 stop:853 length:732 start_codon:yes stop_codon:yes gene_type:complete
MKVGLYAVETSNGFDQDGLVERIASIVNGNNLDVFLALEWLFVPKDRLYKEPEKEDIVHRLAELTADSGALVIPGTMLWEDRRYIYNTAHVISGGEVSEYHKFSDGGSIRMSRERGCQKRLRKQKRKKRFNWNSLDIGLEICSEGGFLFRNLNQLPDMYLFTACGRELNDYSLPIRKHGFAFGVNGNVPKASAVAYTNPHDVLPQLKRRSMSYYVSSDDAHTLKLLIPQVDGNLFTYEIPNLG